MHPCVWTRFEGGRGGKILNMETQCEELSFTTEIIGKVNLFLCLINYKHYAMKTHGVEVYVSQNIIKKQFHLTVNNSHCGVTGLQYLYCVVTPHSALITFSLKVWSGFYQRQFSSHCSLRNCIVGCINTTIHTMLPQCIWLNCLSPTFRHKFFG
jgi:hypothetical protein